MENLLIRIKIMKIYIYYFTNETPTSSSLSSNAFDILKRIKLIKEKLL